MKPRIRNLLIVAGGLVLVVAFSVLGMHHGSKATPVKTTTIAYAPFALKLPENGVVQHPDAVTVPTLVAGNIHAIYVKAGAAVHVGELLATIDNPTLEYTAAGAQADYTNAVATVQTARIDEQNARVQYQATVATQRSALNEAQRVYDADVALLAQKAIARSQVDADKAKLDQAKVAYEQAVQQLKLGAVSGYGTSSVQAAQANAEKARIVNEQNQQQLAFTRIVSPIDGIVQTVATEPSNALRTLQNGDPVTAGQALFTVASGNGYIVKAEVDEQDIINVKLGQRVDVTSQDFPNQTIPGHVAQIAPVAVKSTDAASTSMQVLVTVALDRSPSFLKDGLTVDVDILTTDLAHALAVPTLALHKDGKKQFVYVIDHGKAAKVFVRTGVSNDTSTLVLSGIAPGAMVITDKNATILPGAAVTPLPSSSPSPGNGGGLSVTVGG